MTTDAITKSYIATGLVLFDSIASEKGTWLLTVDLDRTAMPTFIRNQYRFAEDLVRFVESRCTARKLVMVIQQPA
jgi:hypothetical protein